MSGDPSPQAFAQREELDEALKRRVDCGAWSPALQEQHKRETDASTLKMLRFQLTVTMVVSTLSLVWDIWAVPGQIQLAVSWRLLAIWPLVVIGLFMLRPHQIGALKAVLAASLISYGMLSIQLGSYGNAEVMVRYAMAAAYVLGISCLALPFKPRELKRYALTFILATSLAGIWPNALPPTELLLHILFMVMSGLPVLAIARLHWESNARAFLLDMRDELTRLELEENNRLLQQLSEQDPLTGMPNRRQFERVCHEGLAAPRGSSKGRIALMMIDLDHFKAFNDRHGHQAGDRCLAMAATQLQEVFGTRRGIIARYGGEEFVAALQERVAGEAASLAEDMRLTIARMLVPVRDNSEPLITTSIGLALAPADTTLELEDLIEMADVALYSAKRAGRNRIEIVEASDTALSQDDEESDRRRA